MAKMGKLFIEIQAPNEKVKTRKLFSREYDYVELVNKVRIAYKEMTEGTLYYFEFEDLKGCVHFLGDEAFRNAHIWVQAGD